MLLVMMMMMMMMMMMVLLVVSYHGDTMHCQCWHGKFYPLGKTSWVKLGKRSVLPISKIG